MPNDTVSDLDKTYAIITSKDFNALPIAKTFVGFEPCVSEYSEGGFFADSNYGSTPKEAVFYPLERQQASECPVDVGSNKTIDTRYKHVNYNVSEYDVQLQSGVLALLRNLPMYTTYLP